MALPVRIQRLSSPFRMEDSTDGGRRPGFCPRAAHPPPGVQQGELRAKVESLASALRFLRGRLRDIPEGVPSLDHLLVCLVQAKACIAQDGRTLRRWRDNALFWMHIHEVSADMLLLIPMDMLADEVMSLDAHFRRNIHEPVARATWQGADERSGACAYRRNGGLV
ncbi:hypothetical protein [Cystobacter fuscus]|uniref:hypothetical protein n=1 Tax=Cystobacter fuscus TaxID=43 RepID=UPI0005BC54EE|nr:hypothetical protein [Cystobacter fuscus]